MKTIAGLCLLSVSMFGQQPAPAPEPVPPPLPAQGAAQTTVPVDTTSPGDIDAHNASVKIFYWRSSGNVSLIGGNLIPTDPNTGFPEVVPPGSENLAPLGSDNLRTPGASISFPAGKYNRLEITYFQAIGNGDTTATQDLTLFGQNVPASDFLSSSYKLRSISATWNYLTWPAPPEESRLRVKTLWGFEWTHISSITNAPYDTNINFSPPIGSKNIFYPKFGVEAEYVLSKYLYVDASASGFAFPHRAVFWDADASVVAHVKHFELFGGYKAFHFKTSPSGDQYFKGTLTGPYAGMRWFFD